MPELSGLTYSLNCEKRTGIKELYLFKTSEVADNGVTFDATTREVTDIVMASTKQAYKVEIDDDETSYTGTMVGGYGTRTTHLLNASIYRFDDVTREIVQSWDKSACLGVIARLYNGKDILLGMDFDSDDANDNYRWVKKLNASGTLTSGIVTDSGETATPKVLRGYQWTTNYDVVFVDSSFDYSTFTTPAA